MSCADDEALLAAFEGATLPRDQWTHRAHVKVAYLYVTRHGFHAGLERMRSGIRGLNAAHGTAEGPTSGYNETTTVAFFTIIAATVAAYSAAMPTADADAFCDTHCHLLSATLLRLYYSPAQRMKPEAKIRFVGPDLAPLPRITG